MFPATLILYRTYPRTRSGAEDDLVLRLLHYTPFQYSSSSSDLDHRIAGPASHVMMLGLLVTTIALVLWLHDLRNLVLAGGGHHRLRFC